VYMRLGSEVNHHISLIVERGQHCITVADVSVNKAMSPGVQAFKVLRITRIRERVKVDYLAVSQFLQRHSYERRADEARSARNEQFSRCVMRDYFNTSACRNLG